jgi:hypothetical protein
LASNVVAECAIGAFAGREPCTRKGFPNTATGSGKSQAALTTTKKIDKISDLDITNSGITIH